MTMHKETVGRSGSPSGVGTMIKLGGGGMGTATRKLPTPKFKFLLGFRPLHFEIFFFKRR